MSGRSPLRGSGLRPFGAEPQDASQAKPLVPNAAEMLELADRCEKAMRPDRELSAAIALTVHDWLHEVEGNKPLNCRVRNRFGSPVYIGGASSDMDYTASLDAAMTLASGFGGEVTFFKDGTAKAFLWQPYPMAVEAKAASPALALCAAALKARAALAGEAGTAGTTKIDPVREHATAQPERPNPTPILPKKERTK